MADLCDRRIALRFIVLIGILSFFADFTYEGSRSIVGPYLATLQASGTIVGVVTGFGEFLGYGLRLFSGGMGRRHRPLLADYHLRLCGADGFRAGACLDRQLARGRRVDHS